MYSLSFGHPGIYLPTETDRGPEFTQPSTSSDQILRPLSDGLGEAVAVIPNTVELAGLLGVEVLRRTARDFCEANPRNKNFCTQSQSLIDSTGSKLSRFNERLIQKNKLFREHHPGADLVLTFFEKHRDMQVASCAWVLNHAQAGLETALIHSFKWTPQEARSFLRNTISSALILMPSFWPHRSAAVSRINYRKELWKHPEAFVESKLLNGRLKEDLVLVRYGTPDDRFMWWTSHLEANALQTEAAVQNTLGLLNEFGARSHVIVARIPAGQSIKALVGRAAPIESKTTGQALTGGGVQFKFAEFDPQWIKEVRSIPTEKIPTGKAVSQLFLPRLSTERARVAYLQQSLISAKPPKGIPSHLGMLKSSVETIPLNVQGEGISMKGLLPFVRVEKGGAVLIQNSSTSLNCPKKILGMGPKKTKIFSHKGLNPSQRAEHMMRAAVHRAHEESWQSLYIVWDPAKYPIVTTLERMGCRIDSIGDVSLAGSSRKWAKVSLEKSPSGLHNRAIFAGLFSLGVSGLSQETEAQTAIFPDDFNTGSGNFKMALEQHPSFGRHLEAPQAPDSASSIARPLHQYEASRLAQLGKLTLALGDCLAENAQRFHGLIPPRAAQTIQLLTGSLQFMQGNGSALPSVIAAAGGLLRHRDLVKGANIAGALLSTLACRTALLQAASPAAAIVPGVGIVLGVAGILHSLLSWNDEDESQEAIEALLQDIQDAGEDIFTRVHQQLADQMRMIDQKTSQVLENQQAVAEQIGVAQQQVYSFQTTLFQQEQRHQERETEAVAQMRLAALDLHLDQRSFTQQLDAIGRGVHVLMHSVQRSAESLGRRDWEQQLLNLELYELRTPHRKMRAETFAIALNALKEGLHSSLSWEDVLRVSAATLQLRIHAQQSALPIRQLQPLVQTCAMTLESHLKLKAGELSESQRTWAQDLLELLNLPKLPDEV